MVALCRAVLLVALSCGVLTSAAFGQVELTTKSSSELGAELAEPTSPPADLMESPTRSYAAQPIDLQPVLQQVGTPVSPWSGLYFGSSIVLAKPHLKESFQATLYDAVNDVMTLVPFNSGYRVAPRAWLGVGLANDFGVQTRYWEFNQTFSPFDFAFVSPFAIPGASTATIIFPAAISAAAPGDVLSVRSGLEMRSLDLEGTLRQNWRQTQVLLSGGLRYALIKQDYSARIISGGVQTSSLTWDRKLEGLGPIIGAQLRRPIGGRGFAAVGGGRAGLIFASKDIHRANVGQLPAPPANNGVNFDNADELLMNMEAELGLEWSHRFQACDLFVRGTYEGQLWSDSGGSALGYLGVEGFGISVGLSR